MAFVAKAEGSCVLAVAPSSEAAAEKSTSIFGTPQWQKHAEELALNTYTYALARCTHAGATEGDSDDPVPAAKGHTAPAGQPPGGQQEATKQALRQLAQRLAPPGCNEAATALGEQLVQSLDAGERRSGAAWLSAVASGGDVDASITAAEALDSVDQPNEAAACWRQAAQAGSKAPAVLWQAGQAMLLGQGGAQDFTAGVQSIAQAAMRRHLAATHSLQVVPLDEDVTEAAVAEKYAGQVVHQLLSMSEQVQWQGVLRGTDLAWQAALLVPGNDAQAFQGVLKLSSAAEEESASKPRVREAASLAVRFALKAALTEHPGALQWLGEHMRSPAVRHAIAQAAPGDGSGAATEGFMQRCVKAATAAGSADGDAAYGDLVRWRTRDALQGAELKAAFALAQEAAADGSVHAQAQVAYMREHGMGCDSDMGAAFDEWEAAASKGSITAKARIAAWKASMHVVYQLSAPSQASAVSISQQAEKEGLLAWSAIGFSAPERSAMLRQQAQLAAHRGHDVWSETGVAEASAVDATVGVPWAGVDLSRLRHRCTDRDGAAPPSQPQGQHEQAGNHHLHMQYGGSLLSGGHGGVLSGGGRHLCRPRSRDERESRRPFRGKGGPN